MSHPELPAGDFAFAPSLRKHRVVPGAEAKTRRSIERNLAEIAAHDESARLARFGWWDRAIAEGPGEPVRSYTIEEIAAANIQRHARGPLKSSLWRTWLASNSPADYARSEGLNTLPQA